MDFWPVVLLEDVLEQVRGSVRDDHDGAVTPGSPLRLVQLKHDQRISQPRRTVHTEPGRNVRLFIWGDRPFRDTGSDEVQVN